MRKELLTVLTDADYEVFYPLAQLKSDLVITSGLLDAKLKRLRMAAVRISEQTARCVIIPASIRARFDAPVYDCDAYGISGGYKEGLDRTINGLDLPGPVIAITSITEKATALATSIYRLTNNRVQWLDANGRLAKRYATDELTVVYTAGFAPTHPDRATIQQAVFEIIAHWNEYPGEVNETSPLALPQTASLILNSFWRSASNSRRI